MNSNNLKWSGPVAIFLGMVPIICMFWLNWQIGILWLFVAIAGSYSEKNS